MYYSSVQVNGHNIEFNKDCLFIDGKQIPSHKLKKPITGVRVIGNTIYLGKNKIEFEGFDIYVNGDCVTRQSRLDAGSFEADSTADIFSAPRSSSSRRQLIKRINKNKYIHKDILKYTSTELLEKIDSLDDRMFQPYYNSTRTTPFECVMTLNSTYLDYKKNNSPVRMHTTNLARGGVSLGMGVSSIVSAIILAIAGSSFIPLLLGGVFVGSVGTWIVGRHVKRIKNEKRQDMKVFVESMEKLTETLTRLNTLAHDVEAGKYGKDPFETTKQKEYEDIDYSGLVDDNTDEITLDEDDFHQ